MANIIVPAIIVVPWAPWVPQGPWNNNNGRNNYIGHWNTYNSRMFIHVFILVDPATRISPQYRLDFTAKLRAGLISTEIVNFVNFSELGVPVRQHLR